MSRALIAVLTVSLASLAGGPRNAAAQTFGGEVLESRIAQPLRSFPVRLLRIPTADSVEVCDSTVTDERGLFQLPGRGPGHYRLQFGRRGSRVETSASIDAASEDTTIFRRYAVPILDLVGPDAFGVVDVQAPAQARNVHPLQFPKELQSLGLPGQVLVRYVIDASGHAIPESIVIVSSTHPAFTRAVRDALRTTVWKPAQIGGVAVPLWVEEPFTFSFTEPR